MDTENEIRKLISSNFPAVNAQTLVATMPLEGQGIDSLDMSTLLFAVEEKFDQRIPTDRVSSLRSLQDIVNFLEQA